MVEINLDISVLLSLKLVLIDNIFLFEVIGFVVNKIFEVLGKIIFWMIIYIEIWLWLKLFCIWYIIVWFVNKEV